MFIVKDSKFLECGCGTLVDKKNHQNKHCPICNQKYSAKNQLPNDILDALASSLNNELSPYDSPEGWSGMLYDAGFKVDRLSSNKNKLTIFLSLDKKKLKLVLKIESFTDGK